MSIILRESEWAEKMIQSMTLGKKPYETLCRVARYYIDLGYKKSDVRKKLEIFISKCEPMVSLVKWSDTIDYSINRASKFKAVNIDYIPITKPELEHINSLNSKQIRRLAFTLLCIAKYWNNVLSTDDGWINNKDREIMSMANINTSIRRQGLMYWNLRKEGMVQFSKKVDNTNVRVCFIENGDIILKISDFRNLGYQYLKYCGEPYFECANCGITTKYNNPDKGKMQKYCKTCASEVLIQQRKTYDSKRKATSVA